MIRGKRIGGRRGGGPRHIVACSREADECIYPPISSVLALPAASNRPPPPDWNQMKHATGKHDSGNTLPATYQPTYATANMPTATNQRRHAREHTPTEIRQRTQLLHKPYMSMYKSTCSHMHARTHIHARTRTHTQINTHGIARAGGDGQASSSPGPCRARRRSFDHPG